MDYEENYVCMDRVYYILNWVYYCVFIDCVGRICGVWMD